MVNPQVKRVFLGLVVIGAIVGGLTYAQQSGFIPIPGFKPAVVPEKANLPTLQKLAQAQVPAVALPSSSEADVASTLVRGEFWEWNAQMGLIFANGGAHTTKGSLMEKHKVNLLLSRQDDSNQMGKDLIACADQLAHGSKQCDSGANFVVIMGDGAGQFAAGVNPQLAKLGPDYTVSVIGATGYSRGEDAFMAPPEVKTNPAAAKGLLVSGVLRDGDWNIAMKWAADNNIKNNPDDKTYDPDAINWVNSPDYNQAAQDYVAGKCVELKDIKNGRPTGKSNTHCVTATVTWTPGDVTVATKKGGIVKIVSSREYASQMPAVIIGPKKFFRENRDEIAGLLAATFEGGDQVRAYDAALHKGAEISQQIYNDKDTDANYWYKYYKGTVEKDVQGLKVELGGSAVNNLADNLVLFGLQPGANDNFRSTYNTFARIDVQQYPAIFKDTPIPDVTEVEDKRFVTDAQGVALNSGADADVATYQPADAIDTKRQEVVSKRDYSINFDTGKESLTTSGLRQLNELKDSFAITNLYIKVDGYTDDTGSDAVNRKLSIARANAIKAFLQRAAAANFPDNRFQVSGHGSEDAVASNTTSAGRAANRRVQITLLKQ